MHDAFCALLLKGMNSPTAVLFFWIKCFLGFSSVTVLCLLHVRQMASSSETDGFGTAQSALGVPVIVLLMQSP